MLPTQFFTWFREGRDLPFWTPKRVPEGPWSVPKPLRERLRDERERQLRFGVNFGVPGTETRGQNSMFSFLPQGSTMAGFFDMGVTQK